MPLNPEILAKQYVTSLPEGKRNDVNKVFDIYEAFLAGCRVNPFITDEKTNKVIDPYNTIIGIICKYFNINMSDLRKQTRKREIVYKRQICMYFGLKYTKLSLSVIGGMFNKDHSTAIHARNTITNLVETDRSVRADVDYIDIEIKKLFI